MDHVARIIEIYENQGIEGLFSSPSTPDDIKEVSAKLDTLEKDTKEKVQSILKEFLDGTDKRINELENELLMEKKNLQQSQDNADACIAYLNSAQKGDTE